MSVYEDFLDNTDPDADVVNLRTGPDGEAQPSYVKAQRWKYSGPFVAGMQEGEFKRYVERQLRERREEWTEFLMTHFGEENFEKERRAAQAAGTYHGPVELAQSRYLQQLIIQPAEERAAQLYNQKYESAEAEANARQEAGDLLLEARRKAEQYAAEVKKEEAPEEARNIMKRTLRLVESERSSAERTEREIDEANMPIEIDEAEHEQRETEQQKREAEREIRMAELEHRVNSMLAEGIATAYRRLGIEAPEGSIDVAAVRQHIHKAESDVHGKQAEKERLKEEWVASRIRALRPSLEELAELEKGLRDEHQSLGSPLAALLTRFLDIPAVNTKDIMQSVNAKSMGLSREVDSLTNDREEAPPTTHPAAGLSHIRTNAFMENHPVYGPQAYPSPILSRVLMTRSSIRSNNSTAMLGVGGFAVLDPNSGSTFGKGKSIARRGIDEDPTHLLDEKSKEGNKIFIHPHNAIVDEAGRVRLNVSRADSEAVAVKEGNVEHIIEGRGAGAGRPSPVGLPPMPTNDRRRANYGFGLPDTRQTNQNQSRPARQPRMDGFDAEIRGKGFESGSVQDIARLSKSFKQ